MNPTWSTGGALPSFTPLLTALLVQASECVDIVLFLLVLKDVSLCRRTGAGGQETAGCQPLAAPRPARPGECRAGAQAARGLRPDRRADHGQERRGRRGGSAGLGPPGRRQAPTRGLRPGVYRHGPFAALFLGTMAEGGGLL